MGLSSNTLWHQTKKDGLKGIIKNKCLYLSYCVEDLTSTGYDYASFAYPMVSVCDLPLAETGEYLKKYGDYTIGFSSMWGERNHFSTVWYCSKNSNTLHTVLKMLAKKIREHGVIIEDDIDYQRIVYIMSYIKLYQGELPKRHYKNYRFYDERELRYVPDYNKLRAIGEKPFLWDYEGYKKSHNDSAFLPTTLNIPFEWDDIKYIIVEKESEKEEFRKLIEINSGRNTFDISFFTNKEVKEDIIGMDHNRKELHEIKFATDADIDEIFESLKTC